MRRLSTNNIDKLKIPHMIRLLYGSLVRPKRRQIMYNTTPITAEHGIKAYVKPVLKCNTIFDDLVKAGKRVALVSTSNDSISMIFLKRSIDYYIYDTVDEVNAKAMELIEKDCYDVMVVYNGNYDGTMHKFGTESAEAIAALKANLAFYCKLVDAVKQHWAQHNTFYGFMPDHGCHEIDGGCGAHGLDMEEDMNIVHLYGCNARK